MKNILPVILFVAMLLIGACSVSKTQEQKDVTAQNMRNSSKGLFTDDEAAFLVLAADARKMGILQGKVGQGRASTTALKDYGSMLIKDQSMLLDEIEKLAAKKNIMLLDNLSAKRSNGLEMLKGKEDGKPFDKEFMKMTCIDHERDVKEFEKAKKFSDPDFVAFATQYLPTIEKHLATVKKLQANY